MKPEQLRNILPLYLGQKVEYIDDDINGDFHPWTSAIDKVSADGEIDLNDGTVFSDLGGFGKKEFLLLRPLSSMTEEEAKGLCDGMGVSFKGAVRGHKWVEITFDFGGTYRLIIKDDGSFVYPEGGFSLTPAITAAHLTSLGFDCFNLIGLGIAKDLTDFNQ